MFNLKKLSIVIPAYNEADTIHLILDKVKNVKLINDIQKEFIIVNGAPSTIELRVRNQNYTLKHIHWRSSDRAQN